MTTGGLTASTSTRLVDLIGFSDPIGIRRSITTQFSRQGLASQRVDWHVEVRTFVIANGRMHRVGTGPCRWHGPAPLSGGSGLAIRIDCRPFAPSGLSAS